MAELNRIRFFLVLSFMVCSTHAVQLVLRNADLEFDYCTSIHTNKNGEYLKRAWNRTFSVGVYTTKVVVYVCKILSLNNMKHIEHQNERIAIETELSLQNRVLLYLGVKWPGASHLDSFIGEFIFETIKTELGSSPNIEILGEGDYQKEYQSTQFTYPVYSEDPEGTLRDRLNAMGKN